MKKWIWYYKTEGSNRENKSNIWHKEASSEVCRRSSITAPSNGWLAFRSLSSKVRVKWTDYSCRNFCSCQDDGGALKMIVCSHDVPLFINTELLNAHLETPCDLMSFSWLLSTYSWAVFLSFQYLKPVDTYLCCSMQEEIFQDHGMTGAGAIAIIIIYTQFN